MDVETVDADDKLPEVLTLRAVSATERKCLALLARKMKEEGALLIPHLMIEYEQMKWRKE